MRVIFIPKVFALNRLWRENWIFKSPRPYRWFSLHLVLCSVLRFLLNYPTRLRSSDLQHSIPTKPVPLIYASHPSLRFSLKSYKGRQLSWHLAYFGNTFGLRSTIRRLIFKMPICYIRLRFRFAAAFSA